MKDNDGTILSLFHWTNTKFDEFKYGDIGFHLGTLASAAARQEYKTSLSKDTTTPIGTYKEMYVIAKNPLWLDDIGRWAPADILVQLENMKLVPKSIAVKLWKNPDVDKEGYDLPTTQVVREIIEAHGYDSIFYRNNHEDVGSVSVIALHADQIITVAENGILKEGNGITEPSSDEDIVQSQPRANRKNDTDEYPTSGVHWGIEDGIITEADARVVWEAIANINKRGFSNYHKTIRGESFISSNNILMVVDTDYRYPSIRTIYKFNVSNETDMSYAKEWLIDARGIQSKLQEARTLIEIVYGEGYVNEYDIRYRTSDEGQVRGRKGTDSSADTGEDADRISQQPRTKTLSDHEVLEMAADEVLINDFILKQRKHLHLGGAYIIPMSVII